jgi:hypothetical protein
MAAETVDFDNASLGHQDDIDAMAAEIASGVMSSDALSDTEDSDYPATYDQLAAEVSMLYALTAGDTHGGIPATPHACRRERRCYCDAAHVAPLSQVVAGRRPAADPQSLATPSVNPSEAYQRALERQRSASSPFVQATAFMQAALANIMNPSVSALATCSHVSLLGRASSCHCSYLQHSQVSKSLKT